jgi:hypothetical protein
MKIRDIVRTAVIRTNPYWPFSRLNRLPYYLAIQAFVQLCKRFPAIKSVYLRHGLTEAHWVPALSDIDLALITDSKLSTEEEFSFLNSFWNHHDRIKKLFPMLGEIEILNDENIKLWTQFDISGYRSMGWKLMYGVESERNPFPVNPEILAADSVNYALRFYLGYFLDRFDSRGEESSYLTSQDLKRLVVKILRSLNYVDEKDSKKQIVMGDPDDTTDMLVRALTGLEEGVRFITCNYNNAGSRQNDPVWLSDLDFHNNVVFDNRGFDIKAAAPWDKAIQSIILNYDKRVFIVLKDDLEASALKHCVATIRAVLAQEKTMPVITSSRLFNYMLRHYDPFEYTRLVTYRIVAYGQDMVLDIPPPDKEAFVSYLIRQTPNVLTFPQCHTLISPPHPNWFSGKELDVIMNRFLFVKLYLDTGVIKPWHDELLVECQKRYPEYFIKFSALKEVPDHAAGQECFGLLKNIANDVHNRLANSPVGELQ